MKKTEHFIIWRNAFKETITLNSVLAAAGMAYFAFLSFFPLVLLIIAVASQWFNPLWVEHEIISQLEFIIPGIADLLGENLASVIQARGSVTTTASLLLIWSGSTLFSIITRILDTIWVGRDIRSGIRYRGLALLFVGGLSVLILPLLFISTWITPLLKNLLPDIHPIIYDETVFFTAILVNIALFATLYRFLPHSSPRWRDVWIGATAAGILWAIAKRVFLNYTTDFLSSSNLVYGSVSAIIAFLTWVHLSGLILFFGAYLGVGYSETKKEERRKTNRRKSDTDLYL